MRLSRKSKHKVRANLDMTPLIDVVFQLLIFFMLSSTFVVQTSIAINVPQASGAQQLERKDITVTLEYGSGGPDDGGGVTVTVDRDVAIENWGELQLVLQELADENPNAFLLVRADEAVTTQRLLQVFTQARAAGISQFNILAEEPLESP